MHPASPDQSHSWWWGAVCSSKVLQKFFVVSVLLAVVLFSTSLGKTDFLVQNKHALNFLDFCSQWKQADAGKAALPEGQLGGRLLSSFGVKPDGFPSSLDTSVAFTLSLNGSVHDLIIYRALVIPYEADFPGVIATRASTDTSWAIRFAAYLQAQDFVTDHLQSGNSHYYTSVRFSRDVRVAEEAQLTPQSQLTAESQLWKIQCVSREVGGGLTLAVECPMPRDASPQMEAMNLQSAFQAEMRCSSEDLALKETSLGKFELTVESVPKPDSKFFLAMCIAPTWGAIDPVKWVEYIEYHRRAVGVEHSYVYTYPGTKSKVFDYYAAEGLLSHIVWTTRTSGENLKKSSHYFEQGHMYMDCLARNKLQSSWLAMLDIDEYLGVHPLPGVKDEDSLRYLLTERFASAAALRLDRVGFSIEEEENFLTPLLIERRQEHTIGADNWGTKSIVSPVKVKGSWIHWATEFEKPFPGAGPYDMEFRVPIDTISIGHYRHQKGTHDLPTGPFTTDEPFSNVARWAPRIAEQVEAILSKVIGYIG